MTFMMGKFAADLPGDLLYCKNHMWCRPMPDGRHRFGFSSYAVRLMQDVYFLDWCIDDGTPLTEKQQIGNIETSKAVSDLFAPVAGTIVVLNQDLLSDPSAINADTHGDGWLFDMECDTSGMMDVEAYFQHLESNWELTQKLLKGQINQ